MSEGSKEPGPGAEQAGASVAKASPSADNAKARPSSPNTSDAKADPSSPSTSDAKAGPSSPNTSDAPASPWRAALAIGAAALGASLAQRFAASYSLAAAVGSFAVVYLVAERVGATWSTQPFTSPNARVALTRAAFFGLAPALAAALVGWASGGLRWRLSALSVGLAASVLREGFEAARHETLARWLPRALVGSRVPRAWLVGFQTLAGVAPLLSVAKPEAWVLGVALGLLGAGLLDQSGLWAAPVVAHATLRITCAVLVPSLFEIRWPEGSWSPLEGARGTPALWLATAVGLAAAALWANKLWGRPQSPVAEAL